MDDSFHRRQAARALEADLSPKLRSALMVFGIFDSGRRKVEPGAIIEQAEDELFSIHGTGRPGTGHRVLVRFGMAAAVCGLVTSAAANSNQASSLRSLIDRFHFDFLSSTESESYVVYGDIFSPTVNPKSFEFSKHKFLKFHSYGEPSLMFKVSFSQAYEELMAAFYQEAAQFVAKESSIALSRAAIVVQELILGPLDRMSDKAALFNEMHAETQNSLVKLTKGLLNS